MNKDEEQIYSVDAGLEVRSLDGDTAQEYIEGYALRFDTMSEDMGFREIISKGALDETDLSDVIFTMNHDINQISARNNVTEGVGSLVLTVDNIGLKFTALPTATSYSRDLLSNVKAGIISKCSFRFGLDWDDDEAQSWNWDTNGRGYDVRTIHKIKKISDVSLVTFPAYKDTSATSFMRAKENQETELALAKEKARLEIEILL